MRSDLSATILSAFDNPQGMSAAARLKVARARHFSTDVNVSHQAAFAPAPGISSTPLPQDVCADGANLWTLIAHAGGTLWLGSSHQAMAELLLDASPVACDPVCRPALHCLSDEAALAVVFDAAALWLVTIDLLNRVAISRTKIVDTIHPTHAHIVDPETIVTLCIDDGGVRPAVLHYAGAAWTLYEAPGRFMFPSQVAGADWSAQINYSAAAQLGQRTFVYLTTPTGSVVGMHFNRSHGRWSDSFEAIPADLSRFALANAFVTGDTLFLSGQFRREDASGEFVSPLIYGLLLSSTNGKTFALDRTTVFTGGFEAEDPSPARRWFGAVMTTPDALYGITDGPAAVYSAANAWIALPAHFGHTGLVDDLLIDPIISVRGSLNGSLTIAIPNGDGQNSGKLLPGDIVDIELGIETALNASEWFRLARTVVSAVSRRLVDAGSSLSVTVQPLTVERLSGMTYPFTVALPGRETVRDTLATFDDFERAKDDGYVSFPFATDFWDAGDQATEVQTHNAGQQYEFLSGDLQATLDLHDYPTIDVLPLAIRLYGWSRSGRPTPNDGSIGGDTPSNPDAPNDRVICRLHILRGQVELSVDVAGLDPSSTDHFPQTWLAVEAGSYPITLVTQSGDGLEIGDKIKKVGMVFINDRAGAAETVFVAERVEIPDLKMNVSSFDDTWEEIKATPEAPDEGQLLKRVGTPVVYLAQRPYYAINGSAAAKYDLTGNGAGGGVCILASDGKNFVAARAFPYLIQIIKVRNGETTILDQAIHDFPNPGWIMLRHVDGVFEVRSQNIGEKTWSAPRLTYAWTEADGALLSDPLISHSGIYALLDTPYVRITGFDPDVSSSLGVLPAAPLLEEFPDDGGTIQIEDAKYHYSGVLITPGEIMGPYQGRNVNGPHNYHSDGAAYVGMATEFIRFEWLTNGEHAGAFAGLYLSTDTGRVWPIGQVDYKPFITTGGVRVHLKNRARFFTPAANEDVIGKNVAIWITHAITGLALLSGERTSHAKGSVAYLVGDSAVKLYEFAAASGSDDLTDRDAIDQICRTAGGQARFPGDVVVAERLLGASPWRIENA